ncbi:MAG: MarR family transcriptional regulator [Actinomycetia bacterium]|nr:MarR family transcriptional regulator [Actinomycetes bacterium]
MSTEQVLAALASSDKPLKAAQVVEVTGLERAEVDKAFKELKKQGKIVSPKACFYEAVKDA